MMLVNTFILKISMLMVHKNKGKDIQQIKISTSLDESTITLNRYIK